MQSIFLSGRRKSPPQSLVPRLKRKRGIQLPSLLNTSFNMTFMVPRDRIRTWGRSLFYRLQAGCPGLHIEKAWQHSCCQAFKMWRPQGDLNPCRRRERPVSWARLDDGDETVRSSLVGRARLERATLCLKGRYSTN